jgi:FKBP-type peptidyl-prolyl cis-trans isomerase
MKRAALFTFTLFLIAILYSSCQEDIYIDWKLQNERWLEVHKNDSGFVRTSSGLCYKVLHQGYQRHPDINSAVHVNYRGSLIDGSVFDNDTSWLYLSSTIKGWKEGLPKMQNGGNYVFYIPSALGYDTATTNTQIPPYSVLIFNVELLDSY